MTFLSAVILLNLLHMGASLRAYGRRDRRLARLAFFHSLLSLFGSVALVVSGNDDASGAMVKALAVFAFGSVALLAIRLRDTVRGDRPGHAGWRLGLLACGELCALYLCFVLYDHAAFVGRAGAAVVEPALLGRADPTCQLAVMPRPVDDAHAHYRCVHNVLFSPKATAPFLPWPAYDERASDGLGMAVQPPPVPAPGVR